MLLPAIISREHKNKRTVIKSVQINPHLRTFSPWGAWSSSPNCIPLLPGPFVSCTNSWSGKFHSFPNLEDSFKLSLVKLLSWTTGRAYPKILKLYTWYNYFLCKRKIKAEWPAMYGSWTKNVVLWEIFFDLFETYKTFTWV